MKKIVLTFGLISGAILSLMLLLTLPFADVMSLDTGALIGYTTMVASFMLVFVGVKSYRDTVGGGRVSFGRALAVGLLILAVSSACYVVTWELIYFGVRNDFTARYRDHTLEKARAAGDSPEVVARKAKEFDRFAELYQNPAFNAAITFIEPMPVGLVIALVSAGVLRRNSRGGAAGARS